ncbi:hypothetical protein B296_00043222 [Ensete ventricosum]|uniref:Uncharacterized protein n=1 Tax=Ensete ventricosum TaxID=4639 RepID=A0A426ZFK6_ENSVE|nr:hypothetical protein B296_00043222 [Ensete ventricosum]
MVTSTMGFVLFLHLRPRAERYVSVRQLTSMRIARYRAAPSKSTVGDRFRSTVVIDFDRPLAADRGRNKEKEKKKKKKKKRNIPSLVPYGVCLFGIRR